MFCYFFSSQLLSEKDPGSVISLLLEEQEAALKGEIGEREGKLNAVIRFHDLTINTADRTVEKNGEEIQLTPIEFDLLEMLARHVGRTIPREKLLSQVWGTDFYGDSRTIDVHIAHVRKKLGLGDHIRTVPKIGYRLEE